MNYKNIMKNLKLIKITLINILIIEEIIVIGHTFDMIISNSFFFKNLYNRNIALEIFNIFKFLYFILLFKISL